jgi:hypothetical protein
LWAREPVEATRSAKPAVGLKKASRHDETLWRVRERLGKKTLKGASNGAELLVFGLDAL